MRSLTAASSLVWTGALVACGLVLAGGSGRVSAQQVPTVTVWDFSARDTASADLTESYTDAFETALIQQASIRAVERRRFDRFRSKLNAIRTIGELLGVQSDVATTVRAAGVDAFVFGEVFDDQQGGEFRIDVTVQRMDSVIVAREEAYLPRGRRADPESRRVAMAGLAQKVAARLVPQKASSLAAAAKSPDQTPASGSPEVRPFQNGFLTARVDEVSFSQDVAESYINMSLALEVTSTNDELLVCTRKTLLDDRGGQWDLLQGTGLGSQAAGYNMAFGPNGVSYSLAAHSRLSPRVRDTVVMRFRGASRPQTRPNTVSLSMECFRRRGNIDDPFSIALSRVPIGQN